MPPPPPPAPPSSPAPICSSSSSFNSCTQSPSARSFWHSETTLCIVSRFDAAGHGRANIRETGMSDGEEDGEVTRKVLQRWFCDGEKPLQRCLNWAASRPTRYLVFSHEKLVRQKDGNEKCVREYEAVEGGGGMRLWLRKARPWHAHEVIRGEAPCHAYADVDVDGADPFRKQASAACERLAEALRSEISLRWGVSCEVVQLDASVTGPGGKFSRHLIVRDPSGQHAFESPKHARWFVEDVQRALDLHECLAQGKSFCDLGVYRRNGTLRTFASTKIGQTRPLKFWCAETKSPVPLPRQVSAALFAKTLVSVDPSRLGLTFFKLPPSVSVDLERTFLRSPSPSYLGKRGRDADTLDGSPDTLPSACVRGLRDAVPEFDRNKAWQCQVTNIGWLRLRCNGRMCARKGDAHRSNTVYYMIDPKRWLFRQHCYSARCKTAPRAPWTPVPLRAREVIRTFFPGSSLQPTKPAGYGAAMLATIK